MKKTEIGEGKNERTYKEKESFNQALRKEEEEEDKEEKRKERRRLNEEAQKSSELMYHI